MKLKLQGRTLRTDRDPDQEARQLRLRFQAISNKAFGNRLFRSRGLTRGATSSALQFQALLSPISSMPGSGTLMSGLQSGCSFRQFISQTASPPGISGLRPCIGVFRDTGRASIGTGTGLRANHTRSDGDAGTPRCPRATRRGLYGTFNQIFLEHWVIKKPAFYFRRKFKYDYFKATLSLRQNSSN